MFTFTRRAARRRMLPLAVACTLFGLAAPASAAEITIKIDNFVFVPDTVTIKPGDVVTWQNVDDIPHLIASKKPGAFRSKALDTDDKFTFTFTTEGTYDYFCGLHPHMLGKIIVAP